MIRALAMILVALVAASCGDEQPRTQVMVVIVAETMVTEGSTQAQVRVTSLSGAEPATGLEQTLDLSAQPFPINVAILPFEGDTTRRFRLEVDALDDASSVVASAQLESGFVAGETRAFLLWLRDACVGVTCDSSRTCGEGGDCVPAFVSPENLPNYDDLDSGAPGDAGTDAPTDAPADAPIDGGVVDTGPLCEETETACVDGLDEDCDGMTDCEDPDCMGETCDDGMYCNGVDTCESGACDGHAGDPCEGPTVCNEEMDRCEGCSAKGCPDNAPGPWTACGGYSGTCDDTGTRTREVTSYSCDMTLDVCVPMTTMETGSCSRGSREGITCGSTTTSDGACRRTTECRAGGTFDRTTTTRTCGGGSCLMNTSTSSMSCSLAASSDGTACSAGYCCGATCVARNDSRHCGACNIDCASEGRSCVNAISNNGSRHDLVPAQYVCDCLGFANCRAAGYGPSATCFDNHCQCQCPAASPTSCGGQCQSGTCFENTIEPQSDNFCGY